MFPRTFSICLCTSVLYSSDNLPTISNKVNRKNTSTRQAPQNNVAGISRINISREEKVFNDSITQAWDLKEASRSKKRFNRRDCESDDSGVG